MTDSNNLDPLHGITLKMIVSQLQAQLGWQEMGREINIRCFTHDPSLASSLKFLRRTPWAREKVEQLYVRHCVSESPVWQQARAQREKSD